MKTINSADFDFSVMSDANYAIDWSEANDMILEDGALYSRWDDDDDDYYLSDYDDWSCSSDDDYLRDTWFALTDGMYGDMPAGWDGDTDFLGF